MTEENRFDPARVERIERRLDAEAIRNLKARYAALCDNQYDADGIAMLFAEDALWESPGLGRFEGTFGRTDWQPRRERGQGAPASREDGGEASG
jgi:SnoaL-like domain